MYRLRLHWIGFAALVGTVAIGARLARSVPVGHPATRAAELRISVEGTAVRIAGAESPLLAVLAQQTPSAEEWQQAVTLRVATAPSSLPVAGSYKVDGRSIVFAPAFPLVAGISYDLVVELNRLRAGRLPLAPGHDRRTQRILIPSGPLVARAVVNGVRPSGPVLPANLLRLYLHFSRPMREGDAARHLALVDDSGHEVAGAWLDPGLEMWNASHRRLTVLLDPGRIKRGLRPNLELGPPLVEGRRYRLRVDPGWRDADGAPLLRGFTHEFMVGSPERRTLDPSSWQVTIPVAGTTDPMILRAPVALDHALVSRDIGLIDSTGAGVPVRAKLDSDERTVRLTSPNAWSPGAYQVRVAAQMEDVAGNTVAAAFEADLMDPQVRLSDPGSVAHLSVDIAP